MLWQFSDELKQKKEYLINNGHDAYCLYTLQGVELDISEELNSNYDYLIATPLTKMSHRSNKGKKYDAQDVLLGGYIFVFIDLYMTKNGEHFSRIILFLSYFIYFVSSYFTRILLKKYLRNKSTKALIKGSKSLLLVCNKNNAIELIECINMDNYDYFRICGLCIVDNNCHEERINGFKVVCSIDGLLDYISKNWVDAIVINTRSKKLNSTIVKGLNDSLIPLHVIVDEDIIMDKQNRIVEKIGNYCSITNSNSNHSNYQIFLKRLMDILGGMVGCVLTLFLIIIIGPIIYLSSPGSIFYVSDRVGKNGKIFKFYKFRSMRLDADDLKQDLMKNNRNKDGMMFKIENDHRIIPGIGNFIRKTSIDEFPQFFNVLKGDMSLVGTRPPTLDEWSKYSPYYRSRMSIKPGITGIWQTSGRSEITDFNEVVKLDLQYINNWSINMDIKLIFKTVTNIFSKGKGAM